MSQIEKVHARQILDSRGNPTVEVELALRASAERFRGRVEAAEELAAADGADWDALDPEAQLGYYARARIVLGR